jgi:hypothetical protein
MKHAHLVIDSHQTSLLLCPCIVVLIYKLQWKEGDEEPESWKNFYKYNPSVPIDYSTVHGALEVVNMARSDPSAPRTVRILLRPGRYILREPITIQNGLLANAAVNPARSVTVHIETMEHLPDTFCPSAHDDLTPSCSPSEPEPLKRRKSTRIRNLLNCRNIDMVEDMEVDGTDAAVDLFLDQAVVNTSNMAMMVESPVSAAVTSNGGGGTTMGTAGSHPRINRASLVLRTRRHNEPLIRVRQGSCIIRNIDLKHISHGTGTRNVMILLVLQRLLFKFVLSRKKWKFQ